MTKLFCVLVAFAAAVACVSGQCTDGKIYYGMKIVRAPVQIDQLRNSDGSYKSDPQCTAIYQVTLNTKYATQSELGEIPNDIGMLPVHGVDTTSFNPNGKDWSNYPKSTDAAAQANAKAKFSHTALTEPSGTCNAVSDDVDAYPLGFHSDVLREYHAVCVEVLNAGDRWIEIMMASYEQDQTLCVEDWKSDGLNDNPAQATCGTGETYVCRGSGNQQLQGGTVQQNLKLKFSCKENCEGSAFDFHWRVVASDVIKNGEQQDGEDWCAFRKGDDFPLSLLSPYPDQYTQPAVFDKSTSSASRSVVSIGLLGLLALALAWCF